MYSNCQLMLCMVAVLFCLDASGQPATKGDISASFTRKGDFHFNFAKGSWGIDITLQASFSQESKEYKIYRIVGESAESDVFLKLNDPLNYQFFSQKFNEKIKEKLSVTE